MKIVIGSKIRIIDPKPEVIHWCQQNLVLDNPDYYKKEQMGKWTGGIPKSIYLYEQIGNDLLVPFGCAGSIWHMCQDTEYKVDIRPIEPIEYTSCINLYDYQQKAVDEAVRRKNGVLVMPCGSGKTQCGLEIISRIGGKALWLTHTQDLLNQSKKRAESVLTQGGYGTITEGKVNIGDSITFATIQTISRLDLSSYRDLWDIIIVDECTHCAGSPTKVTQFYKVMSNLSARYKIGLTATPHRADGLEKSMFALLGGVIHEVSRDDVAHTTCPVRVIQLETGWEPDYDCVLMGDGTIDYSKVIDNMIHNDARYNYIVDVLADIKDSMIILANRVEYLVGLCQSMRNAGKRAVCLSGQGQSKKAKAERKEALEKLNNGELDVICCTYQLAAEGLDIPNLRYVVLATPEKDPAKIQQATGRVSRKADGKEYGTVIDFVDDFGMYKSWWSKRKSVYNRLKYDII